MSKMLKKIKNLFQQKDEFTREQSLNVVNTWLAQDKQGKRNNKIQTTTNPSKAKSVKENSKERVEAIAGFIKNAKTSFTDEEFKDRKEEVIKMLQKMKQKKGE